MPYTIFCAITGYEPFSVNIDETRTVGELKNSIKAKAAQILASVDALALTLYRIDVAATDNMKTTMEAVGRSAQNVSSRDPLRPLLSLQAVYPPPGPPGMMVHIFVQLPSSESIDSIDPRVWCVAETSHICIS
jgi:hypothetical protein